MHHSHNTRPPHIRHHIPAAMHPQRPPPVGMNVGHQIRPPQQHHIPNVQQPTGHQQLTPYIPPHQRDTNRPSHQHHPRMNSQQIHHSQVQTKIRQHNNRSVGLPAQQNNSQQTHSAQTGGPQQPIISQTIPASHQTQTGPPQSISIQNKQKPLPSTNTTSQPPTQQKHSSMKQVPISHSLQNTQNQTHLQHPVHSHQQHQPHVGAVVQQSQQPNTQFSQNPQASYKTQQPFKSQSTHKTNQHQQKTPHQPSHRFQQNTHKQSSYNKAPSNYQKSPQGQRQYQQNQHQKPVPSHQVTNIHQPNPPPPRPPPPQKMHNQPTAILQPPKPKIDENNTKIPTSTSSDSVSPNLIAQPQLMQQNHEPSEIVESQFMDNNQTKTQLPPQNINIPIVSTTQQVGKTELVVCGNSRDTSLSNEPLANTKEKTPMCLVNELARYNKIPHQYRLTGEQGPAHCKRFTVTLKLGEEEYTAEGPSIKKAQHTAAADAVSKTKYQHPPAKTIRLKNGRQGIGNITPTVELNALAMKLGEPTVYVYDATPNPGHVAATNVLPPPAGGPHQMLGPTSPQQQTNFPLPVHNPAYTQASPNLSYARHMGNGMYTQQRFQGAPRKSFQRGFGRFPAQQRFPAHQNNVPPSLPREPCRITLIVGKRKFVGIGNTIQLAKHDAAARALEVLKPLASVDGTTESQSGNGDDPESDLKSPISLVHETALKRDFTVSFEVKSERGPPHMKTFITLCKVGDIVTEGEGNGKKISKKRAAEKMLDELKKLPPLSPSKLNTNIMKIKTLKRKPQILKKKPRNLIKEKPESEILEDINPISKLIQIQQALKEREPIYTVVEEKGAPRRREFVIEVSARGQVARGTGSNKKMAKKMAAKNLLILMGYDNVSTNKENNSNIANTHESPGKTRKVIVFHENGNAEGTVLSSNQGGSAGRQIVPGLLLMQQKKPTEVSLQADPNRLTVVANKDEVPPPKSPEKASNISSACHDGVRPKDQLLYLAQLLGFQAVFSDYPKGNHGEYLTIVTLSTDPPQICHGAGSDTEASQDKASITALQLLSTLGLDNVKPKKAQEEQQKLETVKTAIVEGTMD